MGGVKGVGGHEGTYPAKGVLDETGTGCSAKTDGVEGIIVGHEGVYTGDGVMVGAFKNRHVILILGWVLVSFGILCS